jgi:hypothetical protein
VLTCHPSSLPSSLPSLTFALQPYNNKSDVWALGCVLYEMATLRWDKGGAVSLLGGGGVVVVVFIRTS